MHEGPFRIRSRRAGDEIIVALSGAIDIVSGPQMVRTVRQLLEHTGALRRVLVDFSEVTFIDSSGMHAMLDLRADAKGRGYNLAIVLPPGPEVRKPLEVAGLLPLFDIQDSA